MLIPWFLHFPVLRTPSTESAHERLVFSGALSTCPMFLDPDHQPPSKILVFTSSKETPPTLAVCAPIGYDSVGELPLMGQGWRFWARICTLVGERAPRMHCLWCANPTKPNSPTISVTTRPTVAHPDEQTKLSANYTNCANKNPKLAEIRGIRG